MSAMNRDFHLSARGILDRTLFTGFFITEAAFTDAEIATMVDRFICVTGNPNLRIGEIRERERGFEVDILTRSGALVDILYADKYTSWIRSIYGGMRF